MVSEAVVGLARADLSRFVAACYYEPCPDFSEERLFESMQAVAEVLNSDLAALAGRLGKAFAGDDLQTLLVDHTRLFVGPARPVAMPYESFWLPREVGSSEGLLFPVQTLYQEGGFDLDDSFRDLPDHIAVELEFLYVLLFRRCQALNDGDAEKRASVEALRQRLLGEHLGKWVGRFAASLREHAETAFYRELADITEQVVLAELSR